MLRVAKIEELLKQLKKDDNIVCFGAGKRIKDLKELFEETDLLDKIIWFVDNDSKRHGEKIDIHNKNVEIISFNDLKAKNLKNFIILITCVRYQEIVDQLDREDMFKNIDYYSLSHQIAFEKEERAMKKRVPCSLKRNEIELIPRVIHYFWCGGKPLPDQNKRWIDSWHKFCPEYEIIQWSEENYDISKNKYMKQAYENKKWGFVPDYARLDIIYQYGGIYLDTDVELIQSIDDLLYQKGFAGFESDKYVALGLGFGAIKGLPIIKEMLDAYNQIEFCNSDGSLNLTASPILQTELLKNKGLKTNGEYQVVDDLTIFPEKVLSGKSATTRRIRLTPYTRAIHHYEGTWLNEDAKNRNLRFESEIDGKIK